MPKRIVDGEALWGSAKIAQLPVWAKAEYANLLPLALANGVFECDARQIWARVYSFNRPEMTPDQVTQVLNNFEKAGLIGRWKDENGKIWGFFIGIDKEGRLPPQSRINRKHGACGPEPPKHLARRWLANGFTGRGRGSGFGSGLGRDERPSSTAKEKSGAASTEIPDSSVAQAFQAFRDIGTQDPFGPKEFQQIWTEEYGTIGTGTFTDAMERTAVRCKGQGVKVPSLFFTMKRKVEQIEVDHKTHRVPL
jgi:hypothetical protein